MKNMQERIADIDWQQTVTEEINEKGYALVSRFLPAQYCDELIGKYDDSDLYRKTLLALPLSLLHSSINLERRSRITARASESLTTGQKEHPITMLTVSVG
jgi:hypothetical protein